MTPRTLARLIASLPLLVGVLGLAVGYYWPPWGRLANAAASGVLLAWALVCLRQARRLLHDAAALRVEAIELAELVARSTTAEVAYRNAHTTAIHLNRTPRVRN